MTLSKDSISSPLEAGTSILDAHHLPPLLNEALEYVSKRLSRKAMHVTLVIVRREYQIPAGMISCASPAFSSPMSPAPSSTLSSPSRLAFTSSILSLKQRLLQRAVHPLLPDLNSPAYSEGLRSAAASPTFSVSASEASSQFSWPQTPSTPATPMSVPPMTPCTTSSVCTDTSGPLSPNPFGIRLVHASVVSPKEEKMLRHVIDKAEKRYQIGTDWLPPALHPSACGLTDSIIRRSIIQNEVIFSSEGLTLLSLDRLYTFKSALSSYSRSKSPLRLEDAVDELRRLFLSNGARKVAKSDILRSYDWLSVSDSALSDVDRMYRRAYGGPDGVGAIEGMRPPPVEMLIEIEEDDVAVLDDIEFEREDTSLIDKAMTAFHIATTPPAQKGPMLRLQTNFDTPVRGGADGDSDEDEDLTARPKGPNLMTPLWQGVSIDQVLDPGCGAIVSHQPGPMTPNGYEDISPITRGEWGFLFSGDSWSKSKTAAVETC